MHHRNSIFFTSIDVQDAFGREIREHSFIGRHCLQQILVRHKYCTERKGAIDLWDSLETMYCIAAEILERFTGLTAVELFFYSEGIHGTAKNSSLSSPQNYRSCAV